MAITFVAEGSVANVASGNVTPGAPAGTQAGDLLIACIAYRSNAAFTNPTGGEWTTIATQQSSGNTSTTASTAIASGHMAYCIRGASDPNFTFTRTGGNVARAMVFAFRGVDPTTPLDNANAVTEASNTTTPTVSGWTPSRANNLYVQFCAGADNVTSSAWTQSGGSGFSSWTEQEDSNTTSGADTNLSVAWATASGTDAITNFSLTKAASSRHVLFAAGFNVSNAWETGPLALAATGAISVTASTEAFSGALAASAVSGIATSASAEAFTGGLTVSAAGDISTAASTAAFVGALGISATSSISVSASAAETYDTGPLSVSATGSIGVSATSEAFTGAIGAQATSGVSTSASSAAFAQALASAVGGVSVTAISEAFTGGLTLTGVSGIVSFATTATVPISAAFSIARAATAGLTVTAAAGAGVSIEAEDVAALAITLAAGGTIETDEAASAALEFTP